MRGCYLQFLLLLLVLLSCNATKLGSSFNLHTDSKVRCIEEERQALLHFKQHIVDRFHWLSSWDSGTEDCCKWEGIKCSNKTGHVVKLHLRADWLYGFESTTKYLEGEISSSLLGLQYLTYLDLSYNNFFGKSFPNFVGSLAKLQHLNLSYTQIAGIIPQQMGNLSGLISLDLSWNYDLTESHNLNWLTHFSSLRHLDMSGVNLNQVVNWPNKVMMLPSLIHLSLSGCSLSTTTPQLLFINTSSSSQLLFLDLSYNSDLTEAHNLDWITHFSSLKHLDMRKVNLSQIVNWPSKVMLLPSLIHLSLSGCSLSTTTPQLLSINASFSSQLLFLDLSYNSDLTEAHNLDWVTYFSSLKHLDMSGVNLSQVVNWSNKVMLLPSLIHLSLSDCSLFTTPQLLSINASFSSQLLFLDLSYNFDLTEAHNLDWVTHFSSLKYLDMSGVNLSQVVNWPNKVMLLPSLIHLSLSGCSLSTTPQLLSINASSSSQLLFLDLSYNFDLTEAHNLDWVTHFSSLKYLDMSGVNLSQVVNWPNKVMLLPSLIHLSLSGCSLSMTPQLLSINTSSSSQLLFLDLSYNFDLTEAHNLDWVTHFSSLKYLDMSGVNLSQVVNWPNKVMLLPSLIHLSLSGCSLSPTPQLLSINASSSSQLLFLDLSRNYLNCSIFHWLFNSTASLIDLYLGDNELQCSIPNAFSSISSLQRLDLGGNKLVGGIPKSFWNLCSLDSLYLSDNNLTGNLYEFMSNASDCLVDSLRNLKISNNKFIGPLPKSIGNLSNLEILNVAQNFLIGPISFLCELSTPTLLKFLDLSINTLSGEIPDCWTYFHNLVVLNLGSNNFYGKIPHSMGSLSSLEFLHLSHNGLVRKIPKSLQNCSRLKTMDLEANHLSGMVPAWMGDSLPNLVMLSLRSNQLYGSLPLSLCHLSHIQILVLSSNKIEGTIPECFYNLTAMSDLSKNQDIINMYGTNINYWDHASLLWKGREFEFQDNLVLVKMIDISSNRLSGEIPEGITKLTELLALNLSRNNLTGLIPSKIGLLKNLESLDLSRNQLCGEIPMSISSISFLNQLDLSTNNLSGKIPTGTQIQLLNASAFLGNSELCGSPLSNKCLEDLHKNNNIPTDDNDRFITKGFYIAATLGFVGGFWSVCFISVLNIRYIMKRLTSNARMMLT